MTTPVVDRGPLQWRRLADILVIGAGPAGATAARLLAAWGHTTLVVDRRGGDAGRLAESIAPSANKVLRAVGAFDAVQRANFLPWRGNTVWWADEPMRVERFPAESPGYQVLRSDFDRCLRALALEAGAVMDEARVTGFSRADGPDGAWTVLVDRSGTVARYRAHIIIDAAGRSSIFAREGLRVLDQARRTVAVAGTWRSDPGWPVDDHSHTLVASYAGGWAWSVPIDGKRRQFSVMVDPARTDLARGSSSLEIYLAELMKVRPFATVLAEAELIEAPWGADASEYTARQYSGNGFLLAGDAGSAINPLSSFGVKKALASGWLAAIAAHTSLVNPAMASEAFAFFDRRERHVAASAARQAARFAAEAAAGTGYPYWLARTSAIETSVDVGEPDVDELARDPAVIAAFADLRSQSSLRLSPGPNVSLEPRAAIRGREIVMEDHVVTAAWPDGLRYLRGVDLVELMRATPKHRDVGDLFEAVRRSAPGIDLPNFLGALSVLVANGYLRHE